MCKQFLVLHCNYNGEIGQKFDLVITFDWRVALFDMPNLNRFDILLISIFCKIALSISILIFSKITISISISISIFLELSYRYRYQYRYFSELPYRYRYRYRYFSKVSIYRQSICHIDISNRAIQVRARKIILFSFRKIAPSLESEILNPTQ